VGVRRALVVGINEYERRPLDGCVGDAELVAGLLQERFGFEAANVRLLRNGEARRDAFLAELDALVDFTAPGDVALLFYAGHGSRAEDDDDDEGTGFDNTFMVCDNPREDIRDDELRDRLEALGERTEHTVFIVDACHSGTLARGAFGTRGRWYPPVSRGQLPPRNTRAATGRGAGATRGRFLILSAARDSEIAKESEVAGTDGEHHGALTWALVQELQRARPGSTWRDVFDHVAARVTAEHPDQHPQLQGTAEREVFGERDLPPIPHARVLDRAGASVVLSVGAAHGATVGSTFDVFPPGSKDADPNELLGRLEIAVVKGVNSRARIVSEREPGAIVEQARAVESHHVLRTPPLGVQLVAAGVDGGTLDPLRQRLAQVPLLREVEREDEATLRAYLVGAREEVSPTDQLPMLGALAEPRWAVVGREGRLVLTFAPGTTVDEVAAALTRRARYEEALALENRDPGSRMSGGVALALLRRNSEGRWEVADADAEAGIPVYDAGDLVGFRVTSTLDQPVFVTLLDFDPSTEVSLLTRESGGSVEVAARGVFELGTGRTRIRLQRDGDDAIEAFKVIATVQQADFTALTRLDEAARATEELPPLSADDWTTHVCRALVRRRASVAADGRGVAVGATLVSGRGVSATVRSASAPFTPRAPRVSLPSPLAQALEEAGMAESAAMVVGEAQVAAGSRDAGAPAVEVQVPLPAPGYEQVVMAVEPDGLVSWHFAADGSDASRGTDGAVTHRTFSVPVGTAAREGDRGVVGALVQRLINVYVFPAARAAVSSLVRDRAEALELRRSPYGVRSFAPDDYALPGGGEVDGRRWRELAGGPALLMVHGTNSRTHTAFGGLPREVVTTLHERYEGRVFAFDHPTLSHDPRRNVETLLAAIPDGLTLDLDIVCHSRGGLVSRVLAEKQGELPMGARRLQVQRLVFVGSPNAGTRLADEACIGEYLDTTTNLLHALPTHGAADALGFVVSAVKMVACGLLSGLDGLRSMQPGGSFAAWLNTPGRRGAATYLALASDYTPTTASLSRLAADRLMDRVFQGARNDLVVPTAGVGGANGSPYFPIAEQVVFGAADGVPHTGFFQHPRVIGQLLQWLTPRRVAT